MTLFSVIECLNRYELSAKGRKLVTHYFNNSRAETTCLRALAAIEKYFSEEIPPPEERSSELKKLLKELEEHASAWDIDPDD